MKNYKRESNSIYKYTLANLNLRSSKSTSGDIITVIPQGSKVEILDGAEDWYEVIYNNQRGYVYNQYLSKTKYTWTDVFLRSFPTSESNSVALVPVSYTHLIYKFCFLSTFPIFLPILFLSRLACI